MHLYVRRNSSKARAARRAQHLLLLRLFEYFFFKLHPRPHVSLRKGCFDRARPLRSPSFSLSLVASPSPPRSSLSPLLSAPGRRIGKDDDASTWSSALRRRLNINPSAEVAGFQLERRDARGSDTRDKKLPPPPPPGPSSAGERTVRARVYVRLCARVCMCTRSLARDRFSDFGARRPREYPAAEIATENARLSRARPSNRRRGTPNKTESLKRRHALTAGNSGM